MASNAFAQIGMLHGNEPLRSCAEDDRIMTAPAMGIRMCNLLRGQQRTLRIQHLHDCGVGFEHIHPGKEFRAFLELATPIHRAIDLQTIGFSHSVVLVPVTWGGMNTAGALFESDMVAEDEE